MFVAAENFLDSFSSPQALKPSFDGKCAKRARRRNRAVSLAAGALAVVIAGAVPKPADASEKALLNPAQVARPNGLIVLAEGEKKSKHHVEVKVMLKGYDPVAYFKQGKAVRGNPSIRSTYDGVTYFSPLKLIKPTSTRVPKSSSHSTVASAQTVCQKEGETISIPKYSVSIRTSSTFVQLQQT